MIFQQDIEYDKIDDLVKIGMDYSEQAEAEKGMLRLKELDPFFLDFIIQNNLGTKISGVGINWTKPGSGHPDGHLHAKARCVFYIQAPEGAGNLSFPDMGIEIIPHKGLFVLVPPVVNHAILENKSDKIRLTLSFYIE